MKVCDESLYHEIAVIYCFLHLYERMETMEGEALDFITRDFDAWKWRREQRRQSEKKIKKEYLLSAILAFILCLVSFPRVGWTLYYFILPPLIEGSSNSQGKPKREEKRRDILPRL